MKIENLEILDILIKQHENGELMIESLLDFRNDLESSLDIAESEIEELNYRRDKTVTIKYTGTTEGFENYHGKVIVNDTVVDGFSYSPSRNVGKYYSHKKYGKNKISDYNLYRLVEKIVDRG